MKFTNKTQMKPHENAQARIEGNLPSLRVLLWFPSGVMVAFAILCCLQLTGSSTGVHFFNLGQGTDPQLLFGLPRAIRSDEWLVQLSWVVAQVNQGFPVINHLFPGGTDMTLMNELPVWDWSSIFRPHLWGYLLFGLNVGAAWFWWFPAALLLIAVYLFGVTFLPKHSIAVAIFAVGVFFTPMLQWWYTPTSLGSVAWPLLAMTSIMWAVKSSRKTANIVFAVLAGYFAVDLAMGLYLPFIFPGVVLVVFFLLGQGLNWRTDGKKLRDLIKRLVPLGISGIVALLIISLWILTRLDAVNTILSTVYPGQRLEPTGNLWITDPDLGMMLGGPWNGALRTISDGTALGPNQSSGSGYLLISLMLIPGLIWLSWASFKLDRKIDYVAGLLVVAAALILSFMYIPGWDMFAHAIFFDRVPAIRFRIALVVLNPIIWTLVLVTVTRVTDKKNLIIAAVLSLTSFAVLTGAFWIYLSTRNHGIRILEASRFAPIVIILILLCVLFVFFRRGIIVSALAFLGASLLIGGSVNPVYKGLYDLRELDISKSISEIDEANPGVWVSTGSATSMAVLMEGNVNTFSGVQPFPSKAMWKIIDPSNSYETYWNRLAHIHWLISKEDRVITNPQADVVEVSLNPCSDFAQKNIKYVLSDSRVANLDCLEKIESNRQGSTTFDIYRLVPPN